MTGIWKKSLFLCSLAATSLYGISSKGPVYTAQSFGPAVCVVDPVSGASSILATLSENVVNLSNVSQNNVYAVTDVGNVWAINVQTGATQLVTPTPIPTSFPNIAVADSSTAYVTDYSGATMTSVNLQTGAFKRLSPPIASDFFTGIAIGNNSTAYVTGQNSNLVYGINLQTGAIQIVTPDPITGASLFGIALATNDLAYVIGDGDQNVYSVNLNTGAFSLVTAYPLQNTQEVIDINLPNNSTAYVVDDDSTPPNLYVIDIPSGNSRVVGFPFPWQGFVGIGLFQQMNTSPLSGNSLNVAKYINKEAPIDMVRLFALLPDSQLRSALESTSPVRNACATFASQNGYLAPAQVVADHNRQNRFLKQSATALYTATSEIPSDQLFADASDANFVPDIDNTCVTKQKPTCCPIDPCKNPYTVWGAGFGEYARGKSQNQTPAFNMKLGGVVLGFDLNTLGDHMLGFGASYVYTHVNEHKNAGYANVNQGFLTTYGTLNLSNWYIDLGIWGGYYSLTNHRHISFPFFKATAKSSTHGWQLAPHFEFGYDGWQYQQSSGLEWGFEPFVMTDWVANWEKGFKEHGAGFLNMGQKGRFCSLFRGETGFRMNQIPTFTWGRIVFIEKISYAYQKAFHTGSITAFIVGLPGSFSVSTLTGAQNLGVAELSMRFIFNNPSAPYVDFRYQGEFGSKYQSHQGVIELGKAF